MSSLADLNDLPSNEPSFLSDSELHELGRVVNHDFRAPIRHIREFHCALMQDLGNNLNEEHKLYHRYVVDACTQADALTEAFASFLKLCAYTPSIGPTNLQFLKESVCQKFCASDLADCSIELPDKLIQTDLKLLSIILHECMDNALKFHLPQNKSGQGRRQIRVYLQEIRGEIWLIVEDNGIGINAQNREQVFQAFRQLNAKEKYAGVGMGLTRVDIAVRKLKLETAIKDNKPGVCFQLNLGTQQGRPST